VRTLGLVAKTGWALAVVLDGSDGGATVLERCRIDLVPPALPANVYHVAAELDLDSGAAEQLVADVQEEAERNAVAAIGDLAAKYELGAVGLVAASGRVPDRLAAILASHSLVHAAEGELIRNALERGADAAGLPVVRTRQKDLIATAADLLGLDEDAVRGRLADMGRPLGPPWRQEHKDAALAGWLALAG
jgi:hypothetical protein